MRISRLILVGVAGIFAASASNAIAADVYDRGGSSLKDEPAGIAASSFYVVLRGGVAFPENTDFDVDDLNVDNEYDNGYFVSGAVGYSFAKSGGGAIRGELELGYVENEIDSHTITGLDKFSGADAFGETSVFYGLANLYYDFHGFGRVKPFVGAGIGFARVEFDDHGVTPTDVVLDDGDTGFAYQLSAGANIAVTESVDLEIGYRFLGVTGIELEALSGTSSDLDVDNHIVYGGLKFKM